MVVNEVTEENIAPVRAFLEDNSETALFLLSDLLAYGSRLGDDMNSGNYKSVESGGEVQGVFCLTRRGNLLVETGGRTDFAQRIVDACIAEPIAIRGVIGEWCSAVAVWQILCESGSFVEEYRSREILYRLDLCPDHVSATGVTGVRQLVPDDLTQWEPLRAAYLVEEGLPLQGTADQRRINFEQNARAGCWWGYLDDDHLVTTAALNAVYKMTGQVGGVYTAPHWRRRGLARSTMRGLISDCFRLHGLQRLILFTGETNHVARRLYESLGFIQIGEVALLFGSAPGIEAGKSHA